MAEQTQNPGAVTNSFTKGMVKDINETFVGEGLWTHARNLVNNTHDGQTGVVGNEPANLHCVTLPYSLIGAIYINDNQWALFTTDDVNSEIGIFDELNCTYTKIVNDPCLAFKKTSLVTGVSRNRFDCETVLYWDDGINPSRYMDVHKPPFRYTDTVVDGCITRVYSKELDCEKIRLAPLLNHPCLELSKGKGAGTLANGSYQVCMAYTINENRISDYIGLSNIQSLFSHQNLGGSLELKIKTIDTDFDEFELVVVSTVNAQSVAKRLGYYSTVQGTIYIDTISPELVSVPLSFISLRTEALEKSDAMYSVNNYLLRLGVYSNFQFNYQKQANGIITKWQAVQYPSNFYYRGGNNTSYLRDEQYSFFIRWVYNTGNRSASFHIPGRSSVSSDLTPVIGGDAFETIDPVSPEQKKLWQVQNTAVVDNIDKKLLADGGLVIASGRMGYWESTERYPADRSDIWGDLCGKPIRHHKFPDETVDDVLNHYNTDGANIVLMGVSFENITHPLDSTGSPILSIVGYEILRGSREGQKSIVAKGLMNNMREYNIPGNTTIEGLYQNYPYNDLNPDYFLTSDRSILDVSLKNVTDPQDPDFVIDDTDDDGSVDQETRREAKKKLKDLRKKLKEGDPSPGGVNLSFPLSKYRKDYFSFHSPETTFTQPFLGVSEVKIYQEIHGEAVGKFVTCYKHPKLKTVTNFAAIFSSILSAIASIGNTLSILAQDSNIVLQGTEKLPFTKKLTLTKLPNHSVAASLFGTGAEIPDPIKMALNVTIGIYNGVTAVAMTFLESQAIGEQLMNIIYGMIPKRQNALQYDSYGYYNKSRINNQDNRRFKVENASYIGPNLHAFDTKYSVNNVFRSNFVALKLGDDVSNPIVADNSRFRVGEKGGALNTPYKSIISGYYGSLKVSIPSQYGQLESIKQIPISDCIHPALNSNNKYSTDVLFGGDTYINRFTEKNSFFYFNSWMMGEPDESEMDYRNYVNVAFPRFWIDSNRQTFKLFSNATNFRHLDERESSVFFVSKGYFYLFNSGVRDFFVESEVNLAQRDWEEDTSRRHYDPETYIDYESMFRSDIIRGGNYYKYDYSLSISKLFNNFSSWGTLLPRDYDPRTAATCFIYKPNSVVYSLPQELELKKDNWRIFLTNNYKDFATRVTAIKSVNKTGALFIMKNRSPFQFNGVDQLQTEAGIKITIGDGGLFNQPLQSIVNADDSYEYGSSQNRRAILNCTHGVFWVSQEQGKIFQYGGQVKEISSDGMKWWFARYLPSELLRQFPSYPLADNPVVGVGVQMVYDNIHEIIYITKKDYKPAYTDLVLEGSRFYRMVNNVKTYFELDSNAFEDASWTISYDPKNKMWLSFHDWKPTFIIPSKTRFMSVDTDSIWKHNMRCDLFCNFYGKDYPFEVEFVSSTGQMVNSVRSVEYLMEAYRYYNDCADRFHVLDQNFDQAVVYNSEQVSGILELYLKDKSNPFTMLSYPQVQAQSIRILFSKEEQKYRFNQFWDITKDRGEFSSASTPMFITKPNGYEYPINPLYVNYQKPPLERKKFRHNINRVLLRKVKSDDVKLLLKITNQKLLQSPR